MYAPDMAGKIVNACAVLHNMRNHYCMPIIEANIDNGNNNDYNVRQLEHNEMAERGGLRAIATRIQKQIMLNWFPDYIDGDT